MKTKILLIFASILMIVSCPDMKSQIKSLTPGEITIGASTPIPDGIEPTENAYRELVECGFNLGIARGSVDYFKRQFQLIGNLNFKYLIGSPDLLTDARKYYIEAFKNDKHFAGWSFKDEPQFNDLNTLQKQYEAMKKADPKNVIYINLVGVLEKAFTGNISRFADYLNLIQQRFNPDVWSYDFYPIIVKRGVQEIQYDQFYEDLENFMTISRKTGKPFYTFIESMAYETSWYSRPVATEEALRWEAFSALAYGAQGVMYWTYGMRKTYGAEKYISALVNLDGKKTPVWNYAKKVNGEIKRFNQVFYGCRVNEVRHTGDKIYKGTRKLSGGLGPIKMLRSGSQGVIISLLSSKGEEYIVIVSRDVERPQKIEIELKSNKKITEISSDTPQTYNWRNDIEINLLPGGYAIFKL